MVGSGIAGHICIKVVAERELLGVSPVLGDIGLRVLLAHSRSGTGEPSRMIVAESTGRWISGVCQSGVAVGAWEGAKVAVEGVVLLKNDDHVFHGPLGDRARR